MSEPRQYVELLLIMESAADLFDEVEAEVAKIHSYETFVLQAAPVCPDFEEGIGLGER